MMTMLLSPSVGECSDRITILNLKIVNGKKLGKDTCEWRAELFNLEERISGFFYSPEIFESFRELKAELQAINNGLWEAEDELRAYPEPDFSQILVYSVCEQVFHLAACAKRIAHLNDERMRLVREINKLFGQEHAAQGAQKMYSGEGR
jgi:hypothetical protein